MFDSIIKLFLKFPFYNRQKKIDSIIKKLLINNFSLLDIGAARGINKRWKFLSEKLDLILVEPNPKEAELLINKNSKVIANCLHSKKNEKLILYETKESLCSSLLQPDAEYLKDFYNNKRFEVINEINLISTTIDEEFKQKSTPNFVKIDTEGSELEILEGSKDSLKHIIGLEIESVFSTFRINQPIFSDVQNFLKKYNFVFIDFLNITRWEMNTQRSYGKPHIVDSLFLKDPKIIINNYNRNLISDDIILKYILILGVYNRSDILLLFLKKLDSKFIQKYELRKLYSLIEKNIKILNLFERISLLIKNIINNQI